ncbi:MAG: hypothetical protein IPF88_03930 [Candidatus Microthrix sp.]|nr:hypothetical protein [Candidatus Microthrix sp.]MBK6437758.1 hypothetical protein [Candidatus Microthrix sp.]
MGMVMPVGALVEEATPPSTPPEGSVVVELVDDVVVVESPPVASVVRVGCDEVVVVSPA